MKKIVILITVVSGLCGNVAAGGISAIRELGSAAGTSVAEAPLPSAPTSAVRGKESRLAIVAVSADVKLNSALREMAIEDRSGDLRATVRELSDGLYDIGLSGGGEFEWVTARAAEGRLAMRAPGMELAMKPLDGNGYYISGSVFDEALGRMKLVAMRVAQDPDEPSVVISGFGTRLTMSGGAVKGYYDREQYTPKTVAAVLSLLAAHLLSSI